MSGADRHFDTGIWQDVPLAPWTYTERTPRLRLFRSNGHPGLFYQACLRMKGEVDYQEHQHEIVCDQRN